MENFRTSRSVITKIYKACSDRILFGQIFCNTESYLGRILQSADFLAAPPELQQFLLIRLQWRNFNGSRETVLPTYHFLQQKTWIFLIFRGFFLDVGNVLEYCRIFIKAIAETDLQKRRILISEKSAFLQSASARTGL